MVNNYFKAGPCGNGYQERVTLVTVAASGNSSGHPNVYDMTSRYYISGNTTETTAGKKTENRDWAGVDYDAGVQYRGDLVYSKDAKNYFAADVPSITINNVRWVQIKMDSPAPTGSIITHSADVAYQKVLAYAGASLHRDEVDARYMEEAANGTATYTGSVTKKPGLIDVVADVNGYTEKTFPTGAHPAGYDTDGDGIPNEWEIRYGLNPNSAADGKTYTLDTKKYYTNLEVYCNSLVEDIMKQGMADGDNSFEEYWPQIGGGTGIFSVEESNAPLTQPEAYNIAGQRVSDSYKGIVIINGKKIAR
jgi:hypothetical protein